MRFHVLPHQNRIEQWPFKSPIAFSAITLKRADSAARDRQCRSPRRPAPTSRGPETKPSPTAELLVITLSLTPRIILHVKPQWDLSWLPGARENSWLQTTPEAKSASECCLAGLLRRYVRRSLESVAPPDMRAIHTGFLRNNLNP